MDEKLYEINSNLRIKVKTNLYTRGIIPTDIEDLVGWNKLGLKEEIEPEIDLLKQKDNENIKHIPQELDEEQKQQARDNIDVNSKLEIQQYLENSYEQLIKESTDLITKAAEELNEKFTDDINLKVTILKEAVDNEIITIKSYVDNLKVQFELEIDNTIKEFKLDLKNLKKEIYQKLNNIKLEIDEKIQALKEGLEFKFFTLKNELYKQFNELKIKNDLEHNNFKKDYLELEDIVRRLQVYKRVDIETELWETYEDDEFEENTVKYIITNEQHKKGQTNNLNITIYDLSSGKAKLTNESIDIEDDGTIIIYSGFAWKGYALIGSNEQVRYELPKERLRLLTNSSDYLLYNDEDEIIIGY